jgi:acetylornithine/LysW-gamma-L-lysine aminotransferase
VYQSERIPEQAAAKGAWLLQTLRDLRLPSVREVRGLGLLVGLELKSRSQPAIAALIDHGVLALPAGPNVLRLLPPLVIEQADLERVVTAIEAVLSTEER